MAQGTIHRHTRHWRIGALAALAVIAGAVMATANGGLSLTTGSVQMTLGVSAETGLEIRFLRALPKSHGPAVPQLSGKIRQG